MKLVCLSISKQERPKQYLHEFCCFEQWHMKLPFRGRHTSLEELLLLQGSLRRTVGSNISFSYRGNNWEGRKITQIFINYLSMTVLRLSSDLQEGTDLVIKVQYIPKKPHTVSYIFSCTNKPSHFY